MQSFIAQNIPEGFAFRAFTFTDLLQKFVILRCALFDCTIVHIGACNSLKKRKKTQYIAQRQNND